jgi:DNA-binding response OmpR family regulator
MMEVALNRDNWRTETSLTLADASKKIRQQNPFLLLVDRRMPDGDGFQLIRSLGPRPDMGFIVVTGDNTEIDRVVALELGADVFLAKPFSPRELAAQVRAIARRLGMAQAPRSETSDGGCDLSAPRSISTATFDTRRLKLMALDGRIVRLTESEAGLLDLLMTANGEPVERDRVAREVLKQHRLLPGQRSVDQLVCLLRRKLDDATGGSVCVVPVRGVGYRLIV